MATFTKGQDVKFDRNAVTKSDSTKIVAVVPKQENLPDGMEMPQTYVIEYAEGWLPNSLRVEQFGLDATKKYLFVSESELTAI